MADGKVVIEIDAESSGFEASLKQVKGTATAAAGAIQKETEAAGANADAAKSGASATADYAKANENATKALNLVVTAATAVATVLGAGITAAVAAGSAYETAFAQTMTIIDQNVVSAEDMSAAIIKLSNDTGTAATALSESVYNAISATGDTANAVSLVADASKLATAGFADEGDALGVLTTITNAYGMSTTEAANISDSLIQTQNLGVTTVGQLASSMGKAIATASAYSIDLHNLESAYVSLTKAGISTEESTTYLSSMFNELGDSGSDVAKVIQDKTGKSFGQLMQSGASLGDVLGILLDSVNGDTEALMNLWGSAEAGKAASAIAGQGVETFNSNLEQLRNSTGLTETAYETMANTLSFQTDKLKTRITNLGTAVYSYFDDSLAEGVGSLSDAFLELTDSVEGGALSEQMEQISAGVADLISTGADLAADVLPKLIEGAAWVLDNGGTIVSVVGGIVTGIVAYKAAVLVATIATKGFTAALAINPIALAVAGAIGLSVALGGLANSMGETLSPAEQLASDIEANAEATAGLAEQIDKTNTAYSEFKGQVSSSAEDNDKMITSLVGLVAAYDGTASSAADVQAFVDELNAAIPGLNLEFDKQTGSLNRSEAAMRAMNEQYAAQQKYESAQKNLTDMLDNEADATEKLETARANLSAAQDKLNAFEEEHTHIVNGNRIANSGYEWSWKNAKDAVTEAKDALTDANTAMDNAKGAVRTARADVDTYGDALDQAAADAEQFADSTDSSTQSVEAQEQAAAAATKSIARIALDAQDAAAAGGDLRTKYDELSGQLEELTGTGDAYIEGLANQALYQLNVAATTQEVGGTFGDMAEKIGVSTAEVAGYLVGAEMSVDDFKSNISDATGNVINSFQKASTSLDMSLGEMKKNLTANIEAQANWNNNMETLWNRAVTNGDSGTRALVQQLYNMGLEGAEQVAQFVNMSDEELAEWSSLFTDAGNEATENAALGAAMGAGMLYDSGVEMGTQFSNGYASTDTSASGAALAGNVAASITAQSPIVEAAGQQLGMAAHTAIANISWTDLGDAVGQGLASGMTSQSATMRTAAQGLATDVVSAWNGKSGTFQQAGANAGTRIQAGLTVQLGSIRAAALNLADSVTTAWTSKAGAFQQSGSTAGIRILTGFSGQQASIRNAGQNAADAVITAWTSKTGAFQQAGVNAGTKLNAGLSSRQGEIQSSAQNLTAIVLAVWTNANAQFQSVGTSASSAVAQGISNGQGTVSGMAYRVANAAYYAMQIDGWYSLGYNISAGVADGVRGGSYLITQAARTAAQNALASAKKSLGVNSPSRVFRDQVGAMIPAGMAQGIAMATPQAQKAVELTSEQLLRATRAALRPSGTMQEAHYVNNTISNYSYSPNRGNTVVLKAPVYLDGREIARASAKYTGRQMAYLEGL